MFKKGDTIDIKLANSEYVGVVDYHDKDCIEIKDVCCLIYQKQAVSVDFKLMKCDLIFYRQRMVMMTLNEEHNYYKAYKEATTGIVL